MSDLTRLYQSETKKYLIKIRDPETGNYIDPSDPTILKDVIAILYIKNNNREVKRMSRTGTEGVQMAIKPDPATGDKMLVIPLEYSIVKEITPGQLAIQITLLWEDTDFEDNTARKSYTAELNPVKQALVN